MSELPVSMMGSVQRTQRKREALVWERVDAPSLSVRKSFAPRFKYPTFFLRRDVMSAGLVEPGLFLRPRRFALTSSRLHLSST